MKTEQQKNKALIRDPNLNQKLAQDKEGASLQESNTDRVQHTQQPHSLPLIVTRLMHATPTLEEIINILHVSLS